MDHKVITHSNKHLIAVHSTLGIFKYNNNKNKWKLYAQYPSHYDGMARKSVIDDKTNKIYIIYGYHMLTFDIPTKQFEATYSVINDGELILMDDDIYLIGYNQIFKWNITNKQFQNIDNFKFEQTEQHLTWYGKVWINTMKSLLIIGGYYTNTIDTASDNIYEYKPNMTLKTVCKLPNTLCCCNCIKTRDEQFVIILGGKTTFILGKFVDDIYVLNVKLMIITKSKIKCPEKGEYHGVCVYDEEYENKLTFGFIRDCWKGLEFGDVMYPPFYLCKFIQQWFVKETLHLFAKKSTLNQRNHFNIDLDNILSS